MPISRRTTRRRTAILILLAAALLFAQCSGLAHRIKHAPTPHEHASSSFDEDHDDDTDALHSCVAFDATTVTDTIHLPPFVAPLLANDAGVLATWAAFASWDALLVRHFSSRAPPLA